MYKQAELTIKGALGDKQIELRLLPWVQLVNPNEPSEEEKKRIEEDWNQRKEKIKHEVEELKYVLTELWKLLKELGIDNDALRASIAKVEARYNAILDSWEAFVPLP